MSDQDKPTWSGLFGMDPAFDRPEGPGRFMITETVTYLITDRETKRVIHVTGDQEWAIDVATEMNRWDQGQVHQHVWENHSAMDGPYRRCVVCGLVEDIDDKALEAGYAELAKDPEYQRRTRFRNSTDQEE